MKRWKLSYEQVHSFDSPVSGHHYCVRCLPKELPYQKVEHCEYEIFPANPVRMSRDAFGNEILSGSIAEEHTRFSVTVSAIVSTESGLCPETREAYRLGMYRCATGLTQMGEHLKAFHCSLPERGRKTDWERTLELLLCLWENFRYLRRRTTVNTTAEQAFSQGCGVCQDYAHILLALCRAEGMTARYVAGAIPGEGQTHAWIEVCQDGFWKGFDPTNRKETDGEYISFAYGRDAMDCSLNRGILRGNARQLQHIYVRMEEL